MKYLIKTKPSNSHISFQIVGLTKYIACFFIFMFTFSIWSEPKVPVESAKESSEQKKAEKDIVANLKATVSSDGNSIDLKWTPPLEEGDLIIARSNEVIDTMEKLGVSDSLGKYRNDKVNVFNSHTDLNLRPGEYYYAVVLVSQVKKKRVKLFPGVNYTITPTVISSSSEKPELPPKMAEVKPETDSISNLKMRNIDDTVRLTWTPPFEAEKNSPKYTIYRSFDPMSSVGLMEKAVKIGEVVHPETTFLDTGLTSTQTVYYGVTVTIGDKETTPLVDRKSFHKFYFVKDETKGAEIAVVEEKKNAEVVNLKPLNIINLKADVRTDGILLTWKEPEGAIDNSTIYFIYESPSLIANESDSTITASAKKIGTVVSPEVSFLHPNLNRKTVAYYAVTTKTGDGDESKILAEGQSFLKVDPDREVGKKRLEKNNDSIKEEENPDFETIMGSYYKRERYKEALIKFRSLADRVDDKSLRAKSLFFAALCHYNMREFKNALKILLKEDVQMNYDKERVDFYVKRCLEKRGSK